jgi:hypothetical protein
MNQNGEWKDFKAFVFRHRTTRWIMERKAAAPIEISCS